MIGDRAVPLALVTTEIVSNSFKHAFPDFRMGTVNVVMVVAEDGAATLTIADDGVARLLKRLIRPQRWARL